MIKIVVLILTVWDCNTGTKIDERRIEEPQSFILSGDRIEACRIFGVSEAQKLTDHFQNGNVSTNVNCHWEETLGDPA